MSWRHIVGCVLALCLAQISAELVEPAFIEDVREEQTGQRIVSGWQAVPGQIPWQFSLRMVDGTGSVFSCGGSIIHNEWGLSAAHCPGSRVTLVVRTGVTSLTRPVYIFETNTWYNHPTYNDQLPNVVQPNDIALIKFGRRLSFNELLKPIKLQSAADSFRNYDDLQLIASGFGAIWTGGSSTENLNWVYLRGVTNTFCFNTFGSIITSNTICARYWNVTSQSTCQGDSGGPLVLVENGEPVLIGVTSFVAGSQHGGCHSGFPAGFIRPGPFHAWYTQVTGIDFENVDFDDKDATDATTETYTTEATHATDATTETYTTEATHATDATTETYTTEATHATDATTETYTTEATHATDTSPTEDFESEENEITTPRPTTEKDKPTEVDGDTEEEEEEEEEEEQDDDTSESDEKDKKKRRRRCRVSVKVKVRVGK